MHVCPFSVLYLHCQCLFQLSPPEFWQQQQIHIYILIQKHIYYCVKCWYLHIIKPIVSVLKEERRKGLTPGLVFLSLWFLPAEGEAKWTLHEKTMLLFDLFISYNLYTFNILGWSMFSLSAVLQKCDPSYFYVRCVWKYIYI